MPALSPAACSPITRGAPAIKRVTSFELTAFLAAIVALAGTASAAPPSSCERIEYADARDWPVEKLEAAYCQSGRAMYDALGATKGLNARESAPFLRMANECLDREAMFRRVLENVHKRQAPACP